MDGAGANEFPELAPFAGWGSCNLEAGKEGNACTSEFHPTHWSSPSVQSPVLPKLQEHLWGLIVERETKECFLKMY